MKMTINAQRVENKTIFILEEDNFSNDQFFQEVHTVLDNNKSEFAIFDFSSIQIVQSLDFEILKNLIAFNKLRDIESAVCGLDPQTLSISIHFLEDLNAPSFLNVEKALERL